MQWVLYIAGHFTAAFSGPDALNLCTVFGKALVDPAYGDVVVCVLTVAI